MRDHEQRSSQEPPKQHHRWHNWGRYEKTKNISMKSKIRLQHALVFSTFLYACETWTLTFELQRKITAVEMRCYRWLLGISYAEHVTNDEMCRRIEEQIGPFVDLLIAVKGGNWGGMVTWQGQMDCLRHSYQKPYRGRHRVVNGNSGWTT